MNRERFEFERVCEGLFERKHRLISGERGACRGIMAANFVVLGSGRIMGVVAVKGINSECGGRTQLWRSAVQFAYLAN